MTRSSAQRSGPQPGARLFTPEGRRDLREELIALARADADVVTAALVGSAARGEEDRWSDIDLVLGIATGVDPDVVARRWTVAMTQRHGAVHHLDVIAGGVLYRVFLLASSLQVDVSFWPQDRVRATEPGFRVLFGAANAPTTPPEPVAEVLAGWAWLYALHARAATARGRRWQAVMMLDELRDQVIALACARHGLPAHHGRGVDRLPAALLERLAASQAYGTDDRGLHRRTTALLTLLLDEVAAVEPDLAERLGPALGLLGSAGQAGTDGG